MAGRKRVPLEKEIQQQCVQLLRLRRWCVIRVNSGRLPWVDKAGRNRSMAMNSQPGCSDTLCVAPDGRFVAIEFKRPGRLAETTPEQERFLEEVRRNNGVAIVADSVETLQLALAQHGYEL